MIKPLLCLIPAVFLFSHDAKAELLEKGIKSGNYCGSKVFKWFKQVKKTKHERIKFEPSQKLLDFAVSMELMCPWEIEKDFNGDNKPDWIGFTKLEDEYQLIAYISIQREYRLSVIETMKTLPKNTFIRPLEPVELKNFSKKKPSSNSSVISLQVSNLEKMTDIYKWNGTKMNKTLTTPQVY